MSWTFQAAIQPRTPRSRLLDLPPELRDIIFEYALTSGRTLVTFRLDTFQRDSLEEAVQPGLMQLNRQVRWETLPIWFACNDFVLHTEESKLKDSRRWLLANEHYLPKIRRFALWVRYVTTLQGRAWSSQGAVSLRITRDPADGGCRVEDVWDWITVVRRPVTLAADAALLIEHLRQVLRDGFRGKLGAEDLWCLLVELRAWYVNKKLSG